MPPRQRRPAEPATEAKLKARWLAVLWLAELQVSPRGWETSTAAQAVQGVHMPPSSHGRASDCLQVWRARSDHSESRAGPPPAHTPSCRGHCARGTPQIRLLSHLKCWAPLQTEWSLRSNQSFTSFHTTSALGSSLGLRLCLHLQLLWPVQHTFTECPALEPVYEVQRDLAAASERLRGGGPSTRLTLYLQTARQSSGGAGPAGSPALFLTSSDHHQQEHLEPPDL